jgi:hypothetical protein
MRVLALILASSLLVFGGCSEGSVDPDPAGAYDPYGGKMDEGAEDPWAPAKDVTAHLVVFPDDHQSPAAYEWPQAGTTGFSMGGTEFWQKWSGGESPTFNFSVGSENGRRCMFASARRFEAIMAVLPENLVILKEDSNWGGSFFNWNDDYSNDSWGSATGARLWAWRTSLVKWISQTNKDGTCYLPTLRMVEDLALDCLEKAEVTGGEIQGCSAREREEEPEDLDEPDVAEPDVAEPDVVEPDVAEPEEEAT